MFKYIVLLSAIVIAGVAALFSVTGLSKLFAGAMIPVIIMASSLEIGKLVTASLLTRFWSGLSRVLKAYYLFAVLILVIITSAGIYGFLTSAYQTTADEMRVLDRQVQVLESKRDRYEEQLQTSDIRLESINQSIGQLTEGLATGTRIQYVDPETGQLVNSTSRYTRESLQEQLDIANQERVELTSNRQEWNDSISSLDLQIIELQSNSEVTAEIGPLRYISNLTGVEMDRVVNWFALLIIFVFDPLAVTLVVAFNRLQLEDEDNDPDDGDGNTVPDDPIIETVTPFETGGESSLEKEIVIDQEDSGKVDEETGVENEEESIELFETKEDKGVDKQPPNVLDLDSNVEKVDRWSALSRNKRLK